MNLHSTKKLANGAEMPYLGLGVYKMTDRDETLEAITTALDLGYRAIDTAALYYNEEEVGKPFAILLYRARISLLQQKFGIATKAMTILYVHSKHH